MGAPQSLLPPPSLLLPIPSLAGGAPCALEFPQNSQMMQEEQGGGSLAGWSVGGCRTSRGTRQLSHLGLVPCVFALLSFASDITVSAQLLCLLDFSLSVVP